MQVERKVLKMAEMKWSTLIALGIPISWIWFALFGWRWDIFYALFIVIVLNIYLGIAVSMLEPPKKKQ